MNPRTKKLTVMAMLIAISVVLVYLVRFPIFPTASFLEYDPADIPILIGAFAYGPLAGIILTVAASVIQGLPSARRADRMASSCTSSHLCLGRRFQLHLPRQSHQKRCAHRAAGRDPVHGRCHDDRKPLCHTPLHGRSHGGGGRHAAACDPALQSCQGRNQLHGYLCAL